MLRAAEEVARAITTAREPTTLKRELATVTAYRNLVGALDRHTRQLLHPHAQPTSLRPSHPVGIDAVTAAMSLQLRDIAGRQVELEPTARSSHWRAAAVAVGAAGDLLATHAEYGGRARSPDLGPVLGSADTRRAAVVNLADLTCTVLEAGAILEKRLVAAGLEPERLRQQLPDTLTAQVLARECARAGPGTNSLEDVHLARPSVDTSHPLLELGDRLVHLRARAWAAAQPGRPSVEDLKVFAALCVAINTHAQAFQAAIARDGTPTSGTVLDGASGRARSWRAAARTLQPWRSAVSAHAGVVGHSRRVFSLLRDVAPLGADAAASALGARDVAQALRAATQISASIAEWNAATLEHLPASRPVGRARDLTGPQVTDSPELAAAKLADQTVGMPRTVYDELRDAYATAAGKPDPLAGVIEPILASQFERAVPEADLLMERS
ncbi:MAG: hypothetical protein KQH57_18715 [Actinomycetales bacterium]|nr:hypothetical protein [Actinomycetales bacterium]